jgi:hypothetical protein
MMHVVSKILFAVTHETRSLLVIKYSGLGCVGRKKSVVYFEYRVYA